MVKLYIYTHYHKYHRTLVIKPLNNKEKTVKIHGDPAKALTFAILFHCNIEGTPSFANGGFIVNATEEEWDTLKLIEKQRRISWKMLVKNGVLSDPQIEKIRAFLCIRPLIK